MFWLMISLAGLLPYMHRGQSWIIIIHCDNPEKQKKQPIFKAMTHASALNTPIFLGGHFSIGLSCVKIGCMGNLVPTCSNNYNNCYFAIYEGIYIYTL